MWGGFSKSSKQKDIWKQHQIHAFAMFWADDPMKLAKEFRIYSARNDYESQCYATRLYDIDLDKVKWEIDEHTTEITFHTKAYNLGNGQTMSCGFDDTLEFESISIQNKDEIFDMINDKSQHVDPEKLVGLVCKSSFPHLPIDTYLVHTWYFTNKIPSDDRKGPWILGFKGWKIRRNGKIK